MKTRIFLLLFVVSLCFSLNIRTQSLDLPIDRGAVGLALAMARLPLTSRVMFVAAHPDDESGGLVTYTSRGLHAKTALLTLTRGEGGQNLVSADLFEPLGLLRTGELIAADQYYGVQQFFTRAFDFGFSRSADETLRFWNREAVLGDMVRAIRKFRPNVIVSFWQGTPKDGHGHHQACGILAQEAFHASGDSHRFPELFREGLFPWQAQRFFLTNPNADTQSVLRVNTGKYDPLLGMSFQQLGAQGYSLHRTQGYGDSFAEAGDHWVRMLRLFPTNGGSGAPMLSAPSGEANSASFRTDGFSEILQGTVSALSSLLKADNSRQKELVKGLNELEALIQQIQSGYSPPSPSESALPLLRGLARLRLLRKELPDVDLRPLPKDHLDFLLAEKEQDFLRAIELSLGLSFEALSDDDQVTPGQAFTVTASVVNRSALVLRLHLLELTADHGWKIEKQGMLTTSLEPGGLARLRFRLTVPEDALPTQVPWKRANRDDRMYSVSPTHSVNDPLPSPVLRARLDYSIASGASVKRNSQDYGEPQTGGRLSDLQLTIFRAVEFRHSDRLKGTRQVPLLIVPEVTLEVNPTLQIVPATTAAQPRSIQVKLINHSNTSVHGDLRLEAPQGWMVQPELSGFDLPVTGQASVLRFQVHTQGAPAPGYITFQATARVNGKAFSQNLRIVRVFDLWTNPWYQRASSNLLVTDVQTPAGLSVGYIAGAGDRVAETLSRLGISVSILGAEDLASGNLDHYDTIVTGVRAYDVRQDLVAFNSRLLEYVHKGGVYVVQYNTPSAWNAAQYAPYPARIASGSDRVTDETAAVRILDPDYPLFHFPNRISEADFGGWVQERGLYFIQDRDPHYRALLSSHDPGYPALDGGLLICEYGKGLYVLTSYSWFRQLPEGVPGAIRLFANLVSLSRNRGK